MSVLVKVKNYKVASIGELHKLALKRIFDKQHMTIMENTLLDLSLKHWPKNAQINEEERRNIAVIISSLIGNEKGEFDWIKGEIAKHGLDYKKAYDGGL